MFGGAGATEVSIKVMLFLKTVGRSWSFDSSFSTVTTTAPVPKQPQTTSYRLHNPNSTLDRASLVFGGAGATEVRNEVMLFS